MMKEFIINNVFKVIKNAGYEAWFVGGCVRDKIMKIKNTDYDICTNCPLEVIKTIFNNIVNIFEKPYYNIFVIGLVIKNGDRTEHIDISTMSPIDLKKLDTPEIKKYSLTKSYNEMLLLKDALRRDFTINVLYEDIDGKIIDPTGLGVLDVKNNILRFVGEDYKTKMNNDPFVMLRFIRFLSTKDLTSFETVESIKQISETLDYNKISKEHKLSELIKTVSGKNWLNSYFLKYFEASGLCKFYGFDKIFEQLKSCNQTYEFHLEGSVWKNIKTEELKNGEEIDYFTDWTPINQGNVYIHNVINS